MELDLSIPSFDGSEAAKPTTISLIDGIVSKTSARIARRHGG